MRKQSICAALALAFCLLAAGAAAAKPKTRNLTFGSDFWVGSTLVKAGTYKVSYEEKTGEVAISDKTSTLARTTVKVEQRGKTKPGWDVVFASKSGGLALVSLAFPGDKQNLVVGDSTTGSADSGASSTVAP
jgi:spermidine/putrescine-binding protein